MKPPKFLNHKWPFSWGRQCERIYIYIYSIDTPIPHIQV